MRIWRLYAYGFDGSRSFHGRGKNGCGMGNDNYELLYASLLLLPFLALVSRYRFYMQATITLSLASWVIPDLTHHVCFSSINHHLAHRSHIAGPLKRVESDPRPHGRQ